MLSAEWLTAPEMSGEKLDGRQADTHTVDSINLLRRSPSQIAQTVHMQVITEDVKVGELWRSNDLICGSRLCFKMV